MTDIIEGLGGKQLMVKRKNSVTAAFDYICLINTKGLSKATRLDAYPGLDQDNPDTTPHDKYTKTGRSTRLTFSGIVDADKYSVLEDDEASESPVEYQLVINKAGADGGRTYQGFVYFESLEMSSSDHGTTKFSGALAFHGAPTVTAAA